MQGSTQTCYHSPRLHANPTTSSTPSNLSLNRSTAANAHSRWHTYILCRCSPTAPRCHPLQPLDGLQLRVRVFGCFVVGGGEGGGGGGGGGRLATRDSTKRHKNAHTPHTQKQQLATPTRGGKKLDGHNGKVLLILYKHSPIAATKKGKSRSVHRAQRIACENGAALCVCDDDARC